MRRREVITLLGGAAAWPLAARAQQSEPIRLIGILAGFAEAEMQPRLAALRGKLRELGWTEGHNLSIDVRVGRGDFNRIRDDAGLLVGLKPDVIITNGTPALTAVRERSRTIPVVFVLVADPVRQGLIESLARPGPYTTETSPISNLRSAESRVDYLMRSGRVLRTSPLLHILPTPTPINFPTLRGESWPPIRPRLPGGAGSNPAGVRGRDRRCGPTVPRRPDRRA